MSNNEKFRDWANIWLDNYKKFSVKETTFNETYKRTVDLYLTPRFKETPLTEITSLQIRSFLNEQSKNFSESTMRKMRLCLNGIFDAAIENNLCEKNPAKNIKVVSRLTPKEKRTYSQSEVDDILTYADIHPFGLFIRILLDLGLRCSELCGLEWSDIDFDKRVINIKRGCTSNK